MFFDGSQIPIKEGRETSLTALQILDFNGQGQPQPSIILNHVLTSRGVWVWIDFPLAICNFQVEKLQWRNNPLHVITCMARGQIPSLISSQIWLFTSCHTYKMIPTFFNISFIKDSRLFFFRESYNLCRPLLIIALYYQTKISISFWCRRELNPKSLIQPSDI